MIPEINKIYRLNEKSVDCDLWFKNFEPNKFYGGYNTINRFIKIKKETKHLYMKHKDVMIHVISEPRTVLDIDYRIYTNFKCLLSIRNKSELVDLSVHICFNPNQSFAIVTTKCLEEII